MPIDPSIASVDLGTLTSSWDADDVILYHLGLGAGVPATDACELQYCLEDRLKVLPTFSVNGPSNLLMGLLALDGVDIPLTSILHGEHEIIVHNPLPTSAAVTHTGRVAELWDKGSAAVVVMETDTRAQDGTKLVTNRYHLFARGEGGFGGQRGPVRDVTLPDRAPDRSVQRTTLEQQALLYRLAGDKNPMHADPDVDAIGSYSARFAQPVFPGETLNVDMWDEGSRVALAVGVAGRGAAALSNTVIERAI
jgi:hypothetical protein